MEVIIGKLFIKLLSMQFYYSHPYNTLKAICLACRTISAGDKLILEIRKSGISTGRAKVYKLDNSSLESVREFAKQIKTDYDKIHILINNGK